MNDLDWDDVRFFLVAARGGSLTSASRVLGTHQPTVGRRIDSLEKRLGMRLFQRHAQGLTLTDEGRRILLAAESMEEAAHALNRVHNRESEIQGTVRLALPEGLSVYLITPALPSLFKRFPGLDVSLMPSSASADLVRGEADIAVRLFRPVENDLVARKIGEMGFGLYGSCAYFEHYGMPSDIAGLNQHHFIGYGHRLRNAEESQWLEKAADDRLFRLRSDDTHARLAAAKAGIGLTVLPHFLARQAQLQAASIATAIPPRSIWLLMHRDLRKLARIRVVTDWLDMLFRENHL